jgi:hypothetical protein
MVRNWREMALPRYAKIDTDNSRGSVGNGEEGTANMSTIGISS